MEYDSMGCLRMAASAIAQCFMPPTKNDTVQSRIEFADSQFIEMFCDCTENFEAKKLSQKIKDAQPQFIG